MQSISIREGNYRPPRLAEREEGKVGTPTINKSHLALRLQKAAHFNLGRIIYIPLNLTKLHGCFCLEAWSGEAAPPTSEPRDRK